MRQVRVKLEQNSYNIHIANSYEPLKELLETYRIKKVCFISDYNVIHLISAELNQIINNIQGEYYEYILEAGEKSKNLSTVSKIYRFLMKKNFNRSDLIISFGGGVVGDIAGYVAATYYRGLKFVQIPTTILSQIDSSVGGKVGVNFGGVKNSIGAFYQPEFVFANVDILKTLPKREFIAGMAEVIVHSIIKSNDLFEYVEKNIEKIMNFDIKLLEYLVEENCKIKSYFVEQDERDKGIRAFLNFGHTFGHAIESYLSYKMRHGECVSLGIVVAFKISEKLGYIDKYLKDRVIDLLKKIGLPIDWRELTHKLDCNKILKIMHQDKKVENGLLVFILPTGIGKVIKMEIADDNIIREVILGE